MAPQQSDPTLTLSNDELLRSAASLAARAKARFLEGSAEDAEVLLEHAKALVHGLDVELEAGIDKLTAHVQKLLASPAPPAPAPAPASTQTTK